MGSARQTKQKQQRKKTKNNPEQYPKKIFGIHVSWDTRKKNKRI